MAVRNVVTRGYGAGASIAFVVTRGYSVGEAVEVVIETPTGGWMFVGVFDDFRRRKIEDEEERKEKEQQIAVIESPVDREIANILQSEQRIADREKELQRLESLVAQSFSNKDLPLAKAYNERVAKAFVRAAVQGNFSAVEALEREMERAREDEEFLLLAMVMLQ